MKRLACKNLVTVHTHTHTHTRINLIDKKRVAQVVSYSKNDMINKIDFYLM